MTAESINTETAEQAPIQKNKPKSPWRWLRRFIYLIFFLLILIIGAVGFVVFTESGLKLVNNILKKSPVNEMVQIDNPTGNLWEGISFDRLNITLNEQDYIEILDAKLKWDLNNILDKKVTVQTLSVGKAEVILTNPSEPKLKDPNAPPFLPFSFKRGQLPVDIIIGDVQAENIAVVLADLFVLASKAHIKDGVISQTTWSFKDVAYKGLLNIGKDFILPLNATASIDANKVTDEVNIRLKNSTVGMLAGDEYFDHAMTLIATGTLNDLKIHDAITLNWPSKLAKPLVIESEIDIKNQADLSWDLTLFNISNQLASKGQWSMNHPTFLEANLDVHLNELKDIYPELTGFIEGDFSFGGSFKKPLLSGNLQGKNITGFDLILDDFSIKAEHNEVRTTEFSANINQVKFADLVLEALGVELKAENLEQFDFSVMLKNLVDKEKTLVDSINLTSQGSLEKHDIQLKIQSIFNTTDFAGVGHIDPEDIKDWSLDINKLDVYSNVVGRYKLLKPSVLKVSPGNIELSLLCLQEYPTTMCMQGSRKGEEGVGSMVIRRLQPKQLNALLAPEVLINTSADLVISGQFIDTKNFKGVVDISLAEGNVRYRTHGYELNVPLKKTHAIIHADPEEVLTEVNIDWGNYLQVHGGGEMKDPFGEQIVDIKIDGNAPTLSWLLPIVPSLQKLSGKLTMGFETTGQLSKGLDMGFNVSLANGEIYNAEYNSSLKNIGLNIVLEKGQPILKVSGGLSAGSGKMAINGQINLKTIDSNIKVTGDSLLLADSENIKAIVSPNINVDIKKTGAVIRGNLAVPELKFIYKSSEDPRGSVQKVSSDTVVISSKRKPQELKADSKFWDNSTVDFNVILGDNVSVGAVGFVGKLTGSLNLLKSVGQPLTALGIINMGSGVYNVLGQELTLDKGRIQFTGLDIANPNIEFQASRMFENKRTGSKVSVGVRVTGTAQNPKLNLFSQPTMPTNSIVSYLALGSDVDSLTAVEVLQIAKMAQRIASGEIVSSPENGFAKSIGLTDFGIMKDLSGNTSLGIGKYLTKNFYAGIGFSLFDEQNGAFGLLRYSFLKYFSFDTQISNEYSTMDLRYSKEL